MEWILEMPLLVYMLVLGLIIFYPIYYAANSTKWNFNRYGKNAAEARIDTLENGKGKRKYKVLLLSPNRELTSIEFRKKDKAEAALTKFQKLLIQKELRTFKKVP